MIYVAFSPYYHHPLPEGHRFPMDKYTGIHVQLINEGSFTSKNFFEPKIKGDQLEALVHNKEYIFKLKNRGLSKTEERRIGFPLNNDLIKCEELICAGTT